MPRSVILNCNLVKIVVILRHNKASTLKNLIYCASTLRLAIIDPNIEAFSIRLMIITVIRALSVIWTRPDRSRVPIVRLLMITPVVPRSTDMRLDILMLTIGD